MYGENKIDKVKHYKYLGIMLDELKVANDYTTYIPYLTYTFYCNVYNMLIIIWCGKG
jgi:hypothetical protein